MLTIAKQRAPMSRKSKWIDADSPDVPAQAVARRAIEARLHTVWDWLPLAAKDATDDIEYVHQLRVATRRAMATLEIFGDLLPPHRGQWYLKQLKRVRQAAGDARDLDVLTERLQHACEVEPQDGCAALLDRVATARAAAQPSIAKTHKKLRRRKFCHCIDKFVDKVRWRTHDVRRPTFREAAQTGMRAVAEAFFRAGEANFDDTQALHQFRIAGKQVRYAMEVFAAAFSPAFRKELYPLVAELQEKLGEINDHATAHERYLAWLNETLDEPQRLILSKLLIVEATALANSTHTFRQWYTPSRAADLKARFHQEVAASELRCA